MRLDTYFSEALSICMNQSLGAFGLNHKLGQTHCVASVNRILQRHPGSSAHRYSTFAEMTFWNCNLSLPQYPSGVVISNVYQVDWCCSNLVDRTQRFFLVVEIEEAWNGSHEL